MNVWVVIQNGDDDCLGVYTSKDKAKKAVERLIKPFLGKEKQVKWIRDTNTEMEAICGYTKFIVWKHKLDHVPLLD